MELQGCSTSTAQLARGLLAAQPTGRLAMRVPALALPALQDASGGGKAWSVRLAAPSLTLCLLYPESAGCASPHFAPRLVAELADLALAAGVRGWAVAGWVGCGPLQRLAGDCSLSWLAQNRGVQLVRMAARKWVARLPGSWQPDGRSS